MILCQCAVCVQDSVTPATKFRNAAMVVSSIGGNRKSEIWRGVQWYNIRTVMYKYSYGLFL
jgi:hypothetical protein